MASNKAVQDVKNNDPMGVRRAYGFQVHEGTEMTDRELDELVRLFALWIVRDLGYKKEIAPTSREVL
jgi:hypothetical protein